MRATHRSWRAWLSGVALGLGLIANVRAQGPAPPRAEAAVPSASSRSSPGVEPIGVRGPGVVPLVPQGGGSEVLATGAEPGSGPGQALVAAQLPTTVVPPEVVPPPPRPIEPGVPPQPPGRNRAGGPAPGADRPLQVGPSGLISLHANDLDIRQALELLSRQGGLNILVSPGVAGRVSVNLEGATLAQALEAILHLGNLAAKKENKIIYICTS